MLSWGSPEAIDYIGQIRPILKEHNVLAIDFAVEFLLNCQRTSTLKDLINACDEGLLGNSSTLESVGLCEGYSAKFNANQFIGSFQYQPGTSAISCTIPTMVARLLFDQLHELVDNANYFPNGQQKVSESFDGVKRHGEYKSWYENGQLQSMGKYQMDMPNGRWIYWHKNGELKAQQFYDHGTRIGTWTEWYDNKNIELIQPYNDLGQHHGTVKEYYENGQLHMQQSFEHGKKVNGKSYESWHENGEKEAEAFYRNQKLVERTFYNTKGQLINHESYEDDLLV